MVKRTEVIKYVIEAVNSDLNVVIKLKDECGGNFPIPVGQSDKVAMEILAFLDRTDGDLTIGDTVDALRSAEWWLTTISIL